jgi:lysylphosphatidylglycerol synthetase-like protein (DUF2156 family)
MQRPRPVTLFAGLALFLASSYLFSGVMLYLGKIDLDEVIRQLPQIADMRETFVHTALVFAVMFGVAYLAAGVGLLLMKNWARALARVLAVLGLLGALVQMIECFTTQEAAGFFFAAVGGGLSYWAFFYLGQPHARAAFNAAPPPGSEPPPVAPGAGSSS